MNQTNSINIIGAGGIGSMLIEELDKCVEQGQIDIFNNSFTISDEDIVELNQIRYQNFEVKDAGKNKADILTKRFNNLGAKSNNQRINKEVQLKPYNFFILCVDNDKTREFVIKHCHKTGKQFIDLRSTGRRVFAMPKLEGITDNMKFIDANDKKEYSCQEKSDLDKGYIQKGNKIIAMIGIQMILNHLRGHNNKIISLTI